MVKRVDKKVPVKTGRLKRSGRVENNPDGSYSVTYGNEEAFYAPVVEDRVGFLESEGEKERIKQSVKVSIKFNESKIKNDARKAAKIAGF